MKLETWLKRNKVSNTELAKRLGYSRTHIQSVINKRYNPSVALIRKIMELTEGRVKPSDMLPSFKEQ